MNKANVLAVANALRSSTLAERGIGFNMVHFCIEADDFVSDRTGHYCNTVACISGWAFALMHPELSVAELRERVMIDEARNWLGLSFEKGQLLFYAMNRSDKVLFTDISPAHAATVLEHLAETGEVVWNLEVRGMNTPRNIEKLTGLLVGTHFHPPAKTLLEALPAGVPLLLVPEPENPYDENAVLVQLPAEFAQWLTWVDANIRLRLEEALPNQGVTLEQVLSTLPCVLGHFGASGGKPLAKAQVEAGMPALSGNKELLEAGLGRAEAKLAFAPSGAALVEVEFSE